MENKLPLPDDLLSSVLEFVPPLDIVKSSSLVSRQFCKVVSQSRFWEMHPLLPEAVVEVMRRSLLTLDRHQLQCSCIWRDHSNHREKKCVTERASWDKKPGQVLHLGSLLPTVSQVSRFSRHEGNRSVCSASSTDNWHEKVENVLGFRALPNLGLSSVNWWSSQPSTTPDTNELLLFTTRYPLALVAAVQIKALADPFIGRETLVYAWNRTIIRVYHFPLEFLSSEEDSGFPCSFPCQTDENPPRPPSRRQEIEDIVSQGTLLHEESFEDSVETGEEHTLCLASGKGVPGNLVTIELVGKRYEQSRGLGYYACVEKVSCVGISLLTAFERKNAVPITASRDFFNE